MALMSRESKRTISRLDLMEGGTPTSQILRASRLRTAQSFLSRREGCLIRGRISTEQLISFLFHLAH